MMKDSVIGTFKIQDQVQVHQVIEFCLLRHLNTQTEKGSCAEAQQLTSGNTLQWKIKVPSELRS